MMRRFTSSPKPASRVARMTSSALGVDAVGRRPAGRSASRRSGPGCSTPRSAGSGSRPPARARSAGRTPRRPRRRPRPAGRPTRWKRGEHAGLVALAAELGDDADPDAGQVTRRRPAGRPSTRSGSGSSMQVESSGSWPPMISCSSAASSTVRVTGPAWSRRVGQRDQAVARHPAVRRLHADRAGDRAGLADRAAGVGADRERRLERRDRGRAEPPPEPPGMRVEVPRVVGRAVGRVLGGGAHRELVHVGLAEDRQPGRAQPGDHGRVVRRDPALEDPRAAGRRQPSGGEDVLDRDRYAVERRSRATRRRGARRRAAASRERALGVDVQERVHRAVDLGDPVEVGLGDLDAGGLAGRRARRRARRRCAASSRRSLLVPEDPRHREALLLDLGRAAERLARRSGRAARRRRGTRWSAAARARSAGCRRRRRRWIDATDSRITRQLGRQVVELGVGRGRSGRGRPGGPPRRG